MDQRRHGVPCVDVDGHDFERDVEDDRTSVREFHVTRRGLEAVELERHRIVPVWQLEAHRARHIRDVDTGRDERIARDRDCRARQDAAQRVRHHRLQPPVLCGEEPGDHQKPHTPE